MTQLDPRSACDQARARALKKRKLRSDLLGYIVVNAFLIGVWAITGFGNFWPGWVLAIWGVLLILAAFDVFYRHDLTEEDIQRETGNGR